ncbi:type II toxin-antitoxin system RelE/ParE family toxin [Olivibacter sitiensis]|uniref:type II toxin-antitoxin system RelE/ParE family toxin n=1 Tax=Olivibacter sitiensis TaxID=376470 RepID=UPI0003FD199E|nr:type II toxin-antitoxin system RelE/ParE family toxin [Olivibacter sitiensis]
MVVIIEDEYLEELVIKGKVSGKQKFPQAVMDRFVIRINQMKAAKNTNDLRNLHSLHFEKLSGDRAGHYSIRVNKGWRIIFHITKENVLEIIHVEGLSNHYG